MRPRPTTSGCRIVRVVVFLCVAWTTNHRSEKMYNFSHPNVYTTVGYFYLLLSTDPGLATAKCLASLNIKPVDTRDGQSHRFHAYPLTREVTGNVDEWYTKKTKNVEDAGIFSSPYNVQHGPDCCARDTVTFHYVEWKETLALMAIREELLKNPLVSDHELKKFMHLEWPHARDEIGFYSRGLPTVEEDWKPLLDTMRKISGRDTQRDC